MKILSLFILAFSFNSAFSDDPISMEDITGLRFTGVMEAELKSGIYREIWQKAGSDGVIYGEAYFVKDGIEKKSEDLKIEFRNDGVYYIPTPAGQKEVEFKLVSFESEVFVFENPEHDFPQRIIYDFSEDGKVTATIETLDPGSDKRLVFRFTKVN